MKYVQENTVDIKEIKSLITENVGHPIKINEWKKEKMVHQYNGVITGAYDCVFSIKFNVKNSSINKSFSYIDFSIGNYSYELE